MGRYIITYRIDASATVTVDADSADEALAKADITDFDSIPEINGATKVWITHPNGKGEAL